MSSSQPVAPKPATYKRYLTSLWHTRWLRAAAIALLWHLSVSVVAGDWYTSISSFFWTVFPLGPAGFKAGLFWITSLVIFMIPLSTFKIGRRCTPSNWITIKNLALSPWVPATVLLWHSVSAFWFCQVFVYLSPSSQELAWVNNGGYGSLDRLNERPLYLFALLQVLAVAHAVWYIIKDKSAMSLPENLQKHPVDKVENVTPLTRITEHAPTMAKTAAAISGVATIITFFSYSLLLRAPLWRFTMIFARAFANISRSDAGPPDSFFVDSIYGKAFFIAFLLSVTWELDILLFNVFMVTPPIKNALPLSASSKDPNGTLLNGLTRKSDLIKTFAFWELFIISGSFPTRRKEIFADIERPHAAPMSCLMVNAGINIIGSIGTRAAEFESLATPAARAGTNSTANAEVQRLPRLLPDAVTAKNPIIVPSNPAASDTGLDRMGNFISHEARILGSSANPWSPPLQKGKQLAIEYSKPTVQDLRARAESVQQSPLGRYLLTSPTRLIESIVLGSPTGNAALQRYAVQSMTNLLVVSLSEDTYGKAISSVPPAIQAMTRSVFDIEHIVRKHTNGVVTETDVYDLKEVLSVHECIKSSLKLLLEKFGSFLRDVGLSIRDLNEAQKAAEDRQFYEVLRPVSVEAPSQQKQRDMEEVSQKSHNQDDRRDRPVSKRQENSVRRPINARNERRPSNTERPGRLFSQLDEGGAIDQAWKERRKSSRDKA